MWMRRSARRMPTARIWRRWWSRPRRPSEQRKAATAERYPTFTFNGDYGDIGVNLATSHGTGNATGTHQRSAVQGVCAARRGRDGAGATGHGAGAGERQERAGGCGCARRAAGYSVGAEAGGSGAIEHGAGQRRAEGSTGALRQRGERQPGSEPGAAIGGAGQRRSMWRAFTGTTWPS